MNSTKEFMNNFIDFCNTSVLYGERNNNGADRYICPSCYASTKIIGYCSSNTGIFQDNIKHDTDCKLVEMFNFANDFIENGVNITI